MLLDAQTEEDVKARYAEFFKIKYNTTDKHDLYHDEVLFEFKSDVNLSSLDGKAKVLAQILYYVYRLKFKQQGEYAKKRIPPFLCLADKNEAVISETATWKKYYSENYDWDLRPSSPDPKLVEDLKKDEHFGLLETFDLRKSFDEMRFTEQLQKILSARQSLALGLDKKIISEANFEEVFEYWDSIFHDDVQNGYKSSRYFICDISANKSEYSESRGGVHFYFDNENVKFKPILKKNYEKFWSIYEKIENPRIIEGILAKIDRLTDDTLRRFEGQFFTPLDFAQKGLEYLEKVLGKDFYKKYKIWDMCAGTGNLEYFIPSEHYHNVYVSTLAEDELEHLKKLFWTIPENVFQYDYLNDDIHRVFADENALQMFDESDWKLPKNLREDLKNPENKWIILINPPYATSQDGSGGLSKNKSEKKGVSSTKIREKMLLQGLGNSSQELFSQFLFRIEKEFRGKNAFLAMYSKVKYINAFNDEELRKKIFNFTFKNGFIFSALNFSGNTGKFPVGFLIWDLFKRKLLENQNIVVDVFESTIRNKEMIRGSAIKIGQKKFVAENKKNFLSNWIERPKNTVPSIPVTSAVSVKYSNARLDKIAENAVGYLAVNANDNQNQNKTVIFSSAFQQGNGFSIIPENFPHSMIVHAVRRIPKATWINDRDQFMQPKNLLSVEFSNDCVVWSLFSGSNQSSSLKNVKYKNQVFQIHNQFFPFASAQVLEWKICNPDIKAQIPKENRFVADFLRSAELSPEGKAVLEIGEKIYEVFFEKWNELDRTKYKLETWDAGWWQVRMSLTDQNFCPELFSEMKKAHEVLKKKLLPQIYEFGFLAEEKIQEEV